MADWGVVRGKLHGPSDELKSMTNGDPSIKQSTMSEGIIVIVFLKGLDPYLLFTPVPKRSVNYRKITLYVFLPILDAKKGNTPRKNR